jgi:hypothetical protein
MRNACPTGSRGADRPTVGAGSDSAAAAVITSATRLSAPHRFHDVVQHGLVCGERADQRLEGGNGAGSAPRG